MIKELLHSDGTITTIPVQPNDLATTGAPSTERIAACTPITPEEIAEVIGAPKQGAFLWLDIERPIEDDLNLLQREFGFHLLAIDDIRHRNQRPKVDDYGSFTHIVVYTVGPDTDTNVHLYEIDLFFSEHYLVAVHHDPVPALAEAISRWRSNTEVLRTGIGALVYAVLDSIVDTYFPVLDSLEGRIEAAEERIFSPERGRGRTEYIADLFTLRRDLLFLRRVVAPTRDVMSALTRHASTQLHAEIALYMQDVYDHVVRALDSVDTYRDLLTGAMEASFSVTSNRLNEVMKTMTAGSIILMADALIAGIYGMNFTNIPELSWRYGYAYALALMVGVTAILAYCFRRAWWI